MIESDLKQLGIFYGSSSGSTEAVAMRLHEKLGGRAVGIHDVAETSLTEILKYKNLILGIPTWGLGELQDDWLKALPVLASIDLTGKNVALFGLGDQESYPDTFGDAMGKLYSTLVRTGCRISGSWHQEGYSFNKSGALMGDHFVGLMLDEKNQGELTGSRIEQWLGMLDFT